MSILRASRSSFFGNFVLVLVALLVCGSASAATLNVSANGSLAYTTVADAVAAANDGDVIQIYPGTYVESILTSKELTLIGVGGASSTILSGDGVQQILRIEGSADFRLQDLTFEDAYGTFDAGAVNARMGTVVLITRCLFRNNWVAHDGGAAHVRNAGSQMIIDDCIFEGNYAGHNSGAVNAVLGALLIIENSRFIDNRSNTISAAIACNDGEMRVSNSVFSRNDSGPVGAIHFYGSTGFVENCTFDRNSGYNGSVLVNTGSSVDVRRNIFFDDLSGPGLEHRSVGDVDCNIFWSNAGGSFTGGSDLGTNQVVDPLFCNPVGFDADLTIWEQSPGAPVNSPCGMLIGALPVSCSNPVSDETTSWGSVKLRY